MAYEQYPIHCLYHGDIISDNDWKKLSPELQKKFAKSDRPVNCTATMDKDGVLHLFEKY